MDQITQAIKNQYMNFPYPAIPAGHMEDEMLCSTDYEFIHYLLKGEYKSHNDIKILDAGCGTGYSTLKLAQRNPNANIIAVDISSESLKLAKERLQTANINMDKINFIEMNLLEIDKLNEKFDYIVSTGVLHHLSDPFKGLINLKSLLKEDGFMYLMLYSDYGRMFLKLTRKMIGILSDDKNDLFEGLTIGKEILNILPEENHILISHKLNHESTIKTFGTDFAESDSQFIDSYVNANERTYNIEELFEFINKAELNFIRFYDEYAYNPELLFKGNPLLIEKAKKLSKVELYKIGEIINSRNNFAFFISHNHIEHKNYSDNEIMNSKILISPFNKKEVIDNNIRVFSPLGTGLNFAPNINFLYEIFLEKEQTFEEIVNNISNKLFFPKSESEILALNFIRALEKEHLIYLN